MKRRQALDTSRRTIVTGVLFAGVTFFFPFLAEAAGPTLKATRVGQKIVWRGYVYTVVSSKGKLVWKQGAKVAAASASASPTTSATPTPSASAVQTPTPMSTPTPSPSASASQTPTPTSTTTPSPTPTKSVEPVAPLRPELGVAIAASTKLKESEFGVFIARNSKGQLLNYALSRKNGAIRAFSTVCTHAGCVVQANRDDLWCPCHSSYFDAYSGKATAGPAIAPLESYMATEAEGWIYIKI